MTIDDEKLSSIYQQEKQQGPPAHLDDMILAAAHEAVTPDGKNESAKGPFSGGWPAMTSIAAVLVITVILVPLIRQEAPPTAALDSLRDAQPLMQEEEAVGRTQSKRLPEKMKKQAMPSLSEPRQEFKSGLNMYQDTAELVEKPVAAERSAVSSPALKRSKPAAVAAGAASVRERALKSEAETQKLNSHMLLVEDDLSAMVLTAEDWLEEIRLLIVAGKRDEALKEIDRFKERYPDEVIESSMLEKLEEIP